MGGNVVHLRHHLRYFGGNLLIGDIFGILGGGHILLRQGVFQEAEIPQLVLIVFRPFLRLGFCLFLRLGFRCFPGIWGFGLSILLDGSFFLRLLGGNLLRSGGLAVHRGNNGGVVGAVALHIGHESLSHLGGILPPVLGVGGAGLEDDLCHLVVCKLRGREGLSGSGLLLGGQLTIVVGLVQNQTQGIHIHGLVETGHGIGDFRGGVGAVVCIRQGGVLQRGKTHKAQITDFELIFLGDIYILRLQIHIQVSGLPAHAEGGAQIQAQIDRLQMGQRVPAELPLQGAAVLSQQIHIVAHLIVHGTNLPVFIRQESFQLGQLGKHLGLLYHTVCQTLKILSGLLRGGIGTGKQQGFQLGRRLGDGNDFDNISFIGTLVNGRAAPHTVVLTDGLTHGKAVQQRGNQFRL